MRRIGRDYERVVAMFSHLDGGRTGCDGLARSSLACVNYQSQLYKKIVKANKRV